MKLRFWGTRGSIAKAGAQTVRYGGNTSCVEVRSDAGTFAMIDCGTGAHGLGQALVEAHPEGPIDGHILITHTHWDHIQGFPFFAPLFREDSTWHVYGPRGFGSSLADTLSGQMQYAYFPVDLEQLDARVIFHDLVEGEFRAGDLRITAQYLNHPALTLGYRIEADDAVLVYASDHEPHERALADGGTPCDGGGDGAHVAFLHDADLVIHDAQYRASEYPEKVGWGHSTLEYAVDCAIAAGVRELALHHHDPLRDDDGVDEGLGMARARAAAAGSSLAIRAAAEGDEIALTGDRPRNTRARATRRDAETAPATAPGCRSVLMVGLAPALAGCVREAAAAEGLEIFHAGDPGEAVAVAGKRRPSVIFVGDPLHGGEPGALCAGVRALPRPYGADAVVIAVAEETAALSPASGAGGAAPDERIVGPLTPQYVRTRLRAWLLRRGCRWRPAPLPPDEEERLAALRATGLLDSAPEARFDHYTRLAAEMFDVPIALLSLVDAERQWFKSRHGLDVSETPRDRAFCAHAILDDGILQVTDTHDDERFADNPLVTGEPRVRFYAGVALKSGEGRRVGTLCLIDHRPRELSARERESLVDLARFVQAEMQRGGR